MGKILHIETSSAFCSVSIAIDGIAVSELRGEIVNDHIAQITTLINNVCTKANLLVKQLDAVAVSAGPGSYTGLRIGVSTAKGICHALNIPLIAVNSLESMVYGVKDIYPEEHLLFCPLIDARRMEVYTLLADKNGKLLLPNQAYILNEGSLFDPFLKNNPIVFFGTGLNKSKPYLNNVNSIFHDNYIQYSTSMHFLANLQFLKGVFEDIAYFEPKYIKEFYTTQKSRQ